MYYVFAWYLIGVLSFLIFDAQEGKVTLYDVFHAIIFGLIGGFIPILYFLWKVIVFIYWVGTTSQEVVLWRKKD